MQAGASLIRGLSVVVDAICNCRQHDEKLVRQIPYRSTPQVCAPSIKNRTRLTPCHSSESSRNASVTRAGSASVWPNQIPSTGCPWCLSLRAKCFSPTSRCDTTSTSSLKVGAAKPWPHTSLCSVSTRSARRYYGASGPSVSKRRVKVAASSHSLATCCRPCSKSSKLSSLIVQPAAIA